MGSQLRGNKRKAVVLAALAVYLVALSLAVHLPERYLELLPDVSEALSHFLCYAGFATLLLLLAGAASPDSRGRRGRVICFIMLLVGAWGLLDELTQPMTGRSFQWGDWVADIAGVLSAVFVVEVIYHGLALRRFRRSDT